MLFLSRDANLLISKIDTKKVKVLQMVEVTTAVLRGVTLPHDRLQEKDVPLLRTEHQRHVPWYALW